MLIDHYTFKIVSDILKLPEFVLDVNIKRFVTSGIFFYGWILQNKRWQVPGKDKHPLLPNST